MSEDVFDPAETKAQHITRGVQDDSGNKVRKAPHHPHAAKPSTGPAVTRRDVVVALSTVQHRQVQGITTVDQLAAFVRGKVVTAEYVAKTNRHLTVIGAFVGTPKDTLATEVANQLLAVRLGANESFGQVMIYGISLGGRRALDVARKVASTVKLAYLGVSDGAFFDADTSNQPIDGNKTGTDPYTPTNIPLMGMMALPNPGPKASRNVFQTKGNLAKLLLGLSQVRDDMWSSKMPGEEIHGRIPGLADDDVTSLCVKQTASELHREAALMGEDRILQDIQTILKSTRN